jgi:hypothetical protein
VIVGRGCLAIALCRPVNRLLSTCLLLGCVCHPVPSASAYRWSVMVANGHRPQVPGGAARSQRNKNPFGKNSPADGLRMPSGTGQQRTACCARLPIALCHQEALRGTRLYLAIYRLSGHPVDALKGFRLHLAVMVGRGCLAIASRGPLNRLRPVRLHMAPEGHSSPSGSAWR